MHGSVTHEPKLVEVFDDAFGQKRFHAFNLHFKIAC